MKIQKRLKLNKNNSVIITDKKLIQEMTQINGIQIEIKIKYLNRSISADRKQLS